MRSSPPRERRAAEDKKTIREGEYRLCDAALDCKLRQRRADADRWAAAARWGESGHKPRGGAIAPPFTIWARPRTGGGGNLAPQGGSGQGPADQCIGLDGAGLRPPGWGVWGAAAPPSRVSDFAPRRASPVLVPRRRSRALRAVTNSQRVHFGRDVIFRKRHSDRGGSLPDRGERFRGEHVTGRGDSFGRGGVVIGRAVGGR